MSGYATISTMNQDQRQGRYHPHRNISRHRQTLDGLVQVFCFDCGQRWYHDEGEVEVPDECHRD